MVVPFWLPLLLGSLFTDGTPRGMAALMLAAAIGVGVADWLRPRA